MLGNFSRLFVVCFFFKINFFKKFFQEYHLGIKKLIWIQIRTDNLSVLIWVKTVFRGYQQTRLVHRNSNVSKIAGALVSPISTHRVLIKNFILTLHVGKLFMIFRNLNLRNFYLSQNPNFLTPDAFPERTFRKSKKYLFKN